MFKMKTFENNIYMKLFRLAYIFLAGNICFLLANFPFFLVVVTTALDPRNSLFFLLSFIPFLPSLMTIMAWLNQWKNDKDINPFQTFFKLYKSLWKAGFKLGGIGLLFTIIATLNFFLLSHFSVGKWFSFFFLIISIGLISFVINNYYFFSKNRDLSISEIYTVSIYFVLRKWYFSFLNSALLIVAMIVMVLKPQFGFLLTPVLFMGLIYLNCSQLYKKSGEE